jgi:hypothetical protein
MRQIARYGFAVAMILSLSSGFTAAADLNTVLEKHLNALGNRDSVEALTSAAMYSSVTYMNLQGQMMSLFKFPTDCYERLDLPVGSQENGFDGSTAWSSDFNGIVRRQSSDEQKPMIDDLYLQSYSYVLPGRLAGTTDFRGDTIIDGVTYYQLAFFPEGGDSMSAFINAENGRLEYTSEIVGGVQMVSHYTDFRMVQGISTPFNVSVESPNGPYHMSATLDSLRYNPAIPDSIFAMPGSTTGDFVFQGDADSSIIPLQFSANRLSIKVSINGFGPYLFILDSGAGTTLISSKLAAELGIKPIGDVPVRGVGGYGNVQFGRIDSMVVGEVSWKLTRVNIFDFGAAMGGRMSQINGILGYDFFVRFPMKIDFDERMLVLYNHDRLLPGDVGNPMPIDVYYQLPLIECMLDGQPVRLAFDLGAEMGLYLRRLSRWYRSEGKDKSKDWRSQRIQGLGGMQAVESGRCDSLRIGSVVVDKPMVMVSTNDRNLPFPDYIEGFLGVDILKRFILLIDYPDNRIYIGGADGSNK